MTRIVSAVTEAQTGRDNSGAFLLAFDWSVIMRSEFLFPEIEAVLSG